MKTRSWKTGKMSTYSVLSSRKRVPLLGSVESKLQVPQIVDEVMSSADIANESNCQRLIGLFSNPSYVFTMLALAAFWFTVCGV